MASASSAIQSAEARLEAARFGLEDMTNVPKRYHSGLMNAVVFGRMVTFSLQKMRNEVPEFEEWYTAQKLGDDPLMRFFKELRNRYEKDAHDGSHVVTHAGHFNLGQIPSPAPPYASSFVFGGWSNGGAAGWTLVFPDGEEDFYPVNLPDSGITNIHVFPDAPEEYSSLSARDMVGEYLSRLDQLIKKARERFL